MERWNLKRWDGADGMLVSEDSLLDTDKELLLHPTARASPSATTAVGVRTGPDSALRQATGIRCSILMMITTFT